MRFWLTNGVFHREFTRESEFPKWDGAKEIKPELIPDEGILYDIPIDAEEIEIPAGTRVIAGHLCDRNIAVSPTEKKLNTKAWQNLKRLILPDGVEEIGSNAFYRCQKLSHVVLPDGLKKIHTFAFSYTGVETIRIPESVNEVGMWAFSNCRQLREIIFPQSDTKIGETVLIDCPALTNVRIPAYVKVISFSGCSALEKIDMTQNTLACSLEGGGYVTFKNCRSLKELTIPSSVKRIYGNFENCSSLQEIVIPSSIKEIGATAFNNCTSLRKVHFKKGKAVVNENAFAGCIKMSARQLQ